MTLNLLNNVMLFQYFFSRLHNSSEQFNLFTDVTFDLKYRHGQIPSEPHVRREGLRNYDAIANGKWTGPSQSPEPQGIMFSALSPKSLEDDEFDDDQRMDIPDRRYGLSPPSY